MLAPALWPKFERLDEVSTAQVHRVARYLYEGVFGDSIAPNHHVPVDLPASEQSSCACWLDAVHQSELVMVCRSSIAR